MNYETLEYIRKHKNLYRLLREDSHYYEMIFQDNRLVYSLNKMAKERYHTRFVDKVDRVGEKINLVSAFLDVLK